MYTSPRVRIYNRFDFASLYLVLIGIAVLPIFVIPGIAQGSLFKSLFATGVIILSSICWIVARLLERHIRVPKNQTLGVLGLFVVSALVSSFSASSVWQALSGDVFAVGSGISVLVFGMYFFLSMYYIHTHRAHMHLAKSLAIGASVALVAQVTFFVLSMPIVPVGMRVNPFFTLLGSTTELGLLAAVAVVAFLFTFEYFHHSRYVRLFAALFLLVGFFVLAVVHSWSLWFIVLLGSVAVFVRTILMLSREENSGLSFDRFPIASLVSIFVAVPFVIQNGLMAGLVTRLFGLPFSESLPNLVSTLNILGHSLLVDPLFGVGPGHFTLAWFRYMSPTDIFGPYWAVAFDTGFSFLTTLGITHGFVGLAAFVAFLGTFVKTLYKNSRPTEAHLQYSFGNELFVLLSGVFILVLLLQNPGIVVWCSAAVVFAAALAPSSLAGKDWTLSMYGFRFAKGVFITLSVSSIVFLTVVGTRLATNGIARFYAAHATSLFENNRTSEAYTALGTALSIDSQDVYYRQYVRQVLAEMSTLTRDTAVLTEHKQEINTLFSNAVLLADRALALDPNNYENILTKAEVNAFGVSLGATDLYSSTQALFESLATRMPKNAAIRFSQARLAALAGNTVDQERYLAEALVVKPNFTEVYLFQAQFAYKRGDLGSAAARLAAAAANDPRNPMVLLNQSFIAFKQGDLKAALGFADTADALGTQSLLVSFVRSYLYAQLGDIAAAKRIISEVLRVVPNNPDALFFQKALESGGVLPSPFGDAVLSKDTASQPKR